MLFVSNIIQSELDLDKWKVKVIITGVELSLVKLEVDVIEDI